jgi:hypothetical protein
MIYAWATWFMRTFLKGVVWSSKNMSSKNLTTLRSSFWDMRLHVLYMDSSIFGHEYSMAAANIDTEIVLPKRRGVLTRISCGVESHPFTSMSLECARENAPRPSRLKNMRAQLFRYSC